jgi:hypothetical protein
LPAGAEAGTRGENRGARGERGEKEGGGGEGESEGGGGEEEGRAGGAGKKSAQGSISASARTAVLNPSLTLRVGSHLDPKGETFSDFSVVEHGCIRVCDVKRKSFQRH